MGFKALKFSKLELPHYIRKILIEKLKPLEGIDIVIVSSLSENIFVIVPSEENEVLISGERISYLIYRIWRLLKNSKWDEMREIYIRGDNKGIIAIPFGNNEFFVAVIFNYPTNLSLINRSIKETLKELENAIVG